MEIITTAPKGTMAPRVSFVLLLIFCNYIGLSFLQGSRNIFDNLPALAAPEAVVLHDELDRYLSTPTEQTDNVLMWWIERCHVFPRLSRMALDYLSIPGK
jgi:hypothetical protein